MVKTEPGRKARFAVDVITSNNSLTSTPVTSLGNNQLLEQSGGVPSSDMWQGQQVESQAWGTEMRTDSSQQESWWLSKAISGLWGRQKWGQMRARKADDAVS